MAKKYITGYFEDDADLKTGIKKLNEAKVTICDVQTPFPVHGLEKVLGYRRSNIPKVGFWGGALGAATGFLFQAWVFTQAWPINYGGKPYLSVPSFVPVTFELTVLFAAFSMVFAFLIRSNLGPGSGNRIFDERVTDDHFLIVLEGNDDSEAEAKKNDLANIGALGITIHEAD